MKVNNILQIFNVVTKTMCNAILACYFYPWAVGKLYIITVVLIKICCTYVPPLNDFSVVKRVVFTLVMLFVSVKNFKNVLLNTIYFKHYILFNFIICGN